MYNAHFVFSCLIIAEDKKWRFKRTRNGQSVNASFVISEHANTNDVQCALLCRQADVCHSMGLDFGT